MKEFLLKRILLKQYKINLTDQKKYNHTTRNLYKIMKIKNILNKILYNLKSLEIQSDRSRIGRREGVKAHLNPQVLKKQHKNPKG